MKLSKRLVVIVVLLIIAIVPALALAQGSGQGERTGTIKMAMGDHPRPVQDSSKSDAQLATGKAVPGAGGQVLPQSEAAKMGLAPQAPDGVLLKVKEGYEGVWPAGSWFTFDNNGGTGGNVCWDDDDWIHKKGSWSAWAANGCADGLDPAVFYYPNDMDSWMVYGPFSTSGAKSANLKFNYWNQSELGWDYLYWCASADGSSWYCFYHTGTTANKWKTGKINLKSVPGYGNMLGDPSVYIAFVFQSDGSVVDDGAFVDEVLLTVKN